MRLLAPKTKQSYLFLAPLGSGLGKAVVAIYPGRAMQWDALAFLPHPTDITDIAPPSTTRLRSLWSAGLSGGSDQHRIRGCGPDGCLLGRIHFPCGYVCLWCMCFCVAEVFFLFSHKVHRSSTWVKVQIRIIKYYSSKSKSTAFSILLEWKYKRT